MEKVNAIVKISVLQKAYKDKWVANYGVSQPGVDNVGTWQWTDNYKIAGTGVDMSYDFSGFYTNATITPESKTVISTPTPKPVAVPKTWVDNLGDTWHAENGKFIVSPNYTLHLRWGARPSASAIGVLTAGSVVKYDAWSRGKEFVYVRQLRANGQYGYVAVRDSKTGEAFGKFE